MNIQYRPIKEDDYDRILLQEESVNSHYLGDPDLF